VPAENRVYRGDGRHLRQCRTPQLVSEHGQTPPFLITQVQPSPTQLHPQHAILFPQERDHVVLLAQDPTAEAATNHWTGDTAGFYANHVRSSFGTVRAYIHLRVAADQQSGPPVDSLMIGQRTQTYAPTLTSAYWWTVIRSHRPFYAARPMLAGRVSATYADKSR
jgi:hypothetical protein